MLLDDLDATTKEYNNQNNIRGNELDKIIEETIILNQNRQSTNNHFTKDRQSYSVIDYAIDTEMLVTILIEYKILKNSALKVLEKSLYQRPMKLIFNFKIQIDKSEGEITTKRQIKTSLKVT